MLTTEKFIEKAHEVHGDKYDYSKTVYRSSKTKVCIICPIHGEFWQTPNGHLNGYGCKKCAIDAQKERQKLPMSEFLSRSNTIHKNKYDYSKVEYKNEKELITIICPIHGEFKQTPYMHSRGAGCPMCKNEKLGKERRITNEEWVKRAKKIHGDRYSYEKTNYMGHKKKVIITCPIHGDFEQLAYDHIQGKGCKKCKKSKMEIEMSDFLDKNGILYVEQYRPPFLNVGKSRMSLDFFIPLYNVAIECQGEQHFVGNTFYSKNINEIVDRDNTKQRLCKENGVKIFYFTNLNELSNKSKNLYTSKEKLLKDIKNEKELL